MGDKVENEVKSMISAVVTSNPLTCTIKRLQEDYKELVGEDIPFRKLGYNSVEHCLRSMPDIVQIIGQGPFAQLKPISKKSAHVNELVMKQRVKPPTNGRKQATMVQRRSSQANNVQLHMRNGRFNVNNSHRNGFSNQHRNGMINNSYQNGMINNSYQNGIKPHPWMNNSLLGMVPNYNVFYNIPQNQIYKLNPIAFPGCPYNNYNYRTYDHNTRTNNNNHNDGARRSNEDNNRGNYNNYNNGVRRDVTVNGDSDRNDSSLNENFSNLEISSKMKEKKYVFIPEEVPKPIQTFAFIPLEGKVEASVEECGEKIPKEVQENLKNLITSNPLGIWCRDLPVKYSGMFGKELNHLDYEYQSLIALCIDLPHIFHYVRPGDGDFKLYDRDRPIPQETEKIFSVASCKVETSEDDDDQNSLDLEELKKHLPNDLITNELIHKQFQYESFHVGDLLELEICEISDMTEFWIHSPENIAALNELMDDLQVFYSKHNEKYAVPIELVRKGLNCICKYSSEYHRGTILNVYDSKKHVQVFLPDYGTICMIPEDKLYFLTENFAQMPLQAIKCNLGCVDPVLNDDNLRRRLTRAFYDLVKQRDIQAVVQKVDSENEVIDLYLVDKETNQCINEAIRKLKYA